MFVLLKFFLSGIFNVRVLYRETIGTSVRCGLFYNLKGCVFASFFILYESLGKGNVKESQTPVNSFTCHRSTSHLFISGQWQQKI